MIDFSKHIKGNQGTKKIDPLEIYDSLDRKSGVGPLRPCQSRILSEWYNTNINDKDLIIKLHTGAGKTLIGLLIALSYLNQDKGPSLYVCPNIYLMLQACSEADKFGIPYCVVSAENDIPSDFYDGKSILITYVQKVFNGLSIFGIKNNSIKVGCVVMDDSHACIDSIIGSCTINVLKDNPAYKELLSIFEDDLKYQGEGTYQDLINDDYKAIMEIPYWSWQENISDVTKILSKHTDDNNVKFAWPLLKNQLCECNAYVSSEKIEISPICTPIQQFGVFSKADHRILMSATTQEDTFFIKGLDFSIDSVKAPLYDKEYRWSGEKMILIPDLIFDPDNSDALLQRICKVPRKFGIAALTPSFNKTEKYNKMGAQTINLPGQNMYKLIQEFKATPKDKIIVAANRYDGIDLPDDTCRILIIDSVPFGNSLADRYEELCREESDIIKIKTVQKIEQGLGRSVRGEKDYSVILIYGNDLIKHLRSSHIRKLFSVQTQKQIEIGLDIVDMAKEDNPQNPDDDFNSLFSTIKQCLDRDENWKAYYASRMDEISPLLNNREKLYKMLKLEYEANKQALLSNYGTACEKIQQIIDSCDNPTEKGWYLQIMAKYQYHLSKKESNTLQISAFKNNDQLLKPISGIEYHKINYAIDDNRVSLIKKYIQKFATADDFYLHIGEILSNLSFGVESEKFENAIMELGLLFGYISQRPDKVIRCGPDNLWCIGINKYIMFECKNEVKSTRDNITKTEAGQMEEHCAWFESEYGKADVLRVLIIPTKKLSPDAFFSHDVKILRKSSLVQLQRKVRNFCKEFKKYNISTITDNTINTLLITHNLHCDNFMEPLLEDPTKTK